ncbi:hypothetical protein TRFO_05559 [Tritrichomonas foetus]|uniref:Uncharacterized protein n=1 Tax=Tritrichomonas foetus TaxID=1144522 RepID=A0A1J4K5V1_9EUKA|nr:hypothetical protein TRFO_05559 [Tritrichomonas foetus]|eukprot:OHT06370.1 hypothetical protein TRFO_05559 [Tritrichomonas foetus]
MKIVTNRPFIHSIDCKKKDRYKKEFMKGRAKTIVIRRQALQKSTSPTYNHQGTSTITRRSVVSPHYAQGRLTQTEPVKKIEDPSAPTFVSTLEDPKLTAFRESIEDGDTFENINDNDLNLLLAHTREYQQTCAAERRYDKAHNAKELVEKIKNEIADRQARIVPDQKAIDDAEKEIQEKNDEYVFLIYSSIRSFYYSIFYEFFFDFFLFIN